MALLTSSKIASARRGDWLDYGAFHVQVGSGTFRVPADGFETDDRAALNMHILNLALAHNDGPTPIGPPMTHEEAWRSAKAGDATDCPEDYAHILDYFPDAVFVVYSPYWGGGGLRTWALKLADGGTWPAFAMLHTIEATEPNTTPRTRLGTVSGVLYGNLELMGGLASL